MSQCQVCNLNKSERLELEKSFLNNQSQASLSRDYNVSVDSIRNHMQNHVSRQLVKSVEMRQAMESGNLLGEIEDLLSRSKHILRRAERDGRLNLALNAIKETRGTLELMSRIAVTLHQIRTAELQAQQEQEGGTHSAEFQEGLSRLSDAELTLFEALMEKMAGVRDDDVALTTLREIKAESWRYIPIPEPKRPRRSVPVIEDVEWTEEREQAAVAEAQAPVIAPEPLQPLQHKPLDLESLELDEPAGTWGRKESSLETALRTGTLRTPYNMGIRGRD